jgi:hypothetical protein
MNKTLLPLFLVVATPALGDPAHEHPMPVMPKEFDTLKQLVGTWEGSAKVHDKDEVVTVVYELTSGGSAITEKAMPGTPHEMITVYHREGKGLAMTHYCAAGNQPHMKLTKADGNSMSFEMVGTSGIDSAGEPHMHALKLTIAGADTLTQEWTHFANGKKVSVAVFNLKRKKG